MDKIKSFYRKAKSWVIEKWYGDVIDRFLVACTVIVLIFLIIILGTYGS